MTLEPKKEHRHQRKEAASPAVPAVEPDRLGPMVPKVPAKEGSAFALQPTQAEASQVATDARDYRVVLRCRTKRMRD